MIVIRVEFLLRTFRGDPEGTAITGNQSRGEWPPSPMRLFSAFVAADGTRNISRVTDGSELEWFETLPPPVIYAQSNPWHQVLHSRYVVEHTGSAVGNTHQEYVARKGALYREGVRVSLRDPNVVYLWPESNSEKDKIDDLVRRAARIGYLGTSDSPVRVHLSNYLPRQISASKWAPDPEGNTRIAVPRKGDLATLDRLFDDWTEHGASISRAQYPTLNHRIRYRSPDKLEQETRGKVLVWLRISPGVSGRRISALTELFKKALLDKHQRIHGDPPNVLHGHGFTESGYDLARFLALPDVGSPHSRGHIHGLALWLPPQVEPQKIQLIRDAALSIDRLEGEGISVSVDPIDAIKNYPWTVNPRRWRGPASTWITAIPVIHERYGEPDLNEAKLWCKHAGLPEPSGFYSSRTPLLPGAIDLAPIEVNRLSRHPKPYSHAVFQFPKPLRGPVVVGAGRQRGFGLCAPIVTQHS